MCQFYIWRDIFKLYRVLNSINDVLPNHFITFRNHGHEIRFAFSKTETHQNLRRLK
jgi:hypothetical protein